jgi:NADPH-dependent 2,4-dienoyl-CoA reductase/sulfur reductase-like enzyme/rhodanese-related sulfurtransferase
MSDPVHRVLIVGASAAGLRCASRLARLKPAWQITVVEAQESFSYAACGLPYVLSGDVPRADDLRRTADGALRDQGYFSAVKGVEVLAGQRVTALDLERYTVRLMPADREIPWDELVLATGARAKRLPGQPEHERVRAFHTWEDLAPLLTKLKRGQIEHVGIIGAGFLGCELAEAFGGLWGAQVTVVEATPAPLWAFLDEEVAVLVARTLAANGVSVLTSQPVEAVLGRDDHVEVAVGGESIRVDVAVVAVGVEPVVELAAAGGIRLGPTGAIAVDDQLRTSVPHVWAAGDCVELKHAITGEPFRLPLGSLANRQGRSLANVMAGRQDRMPPAVGAAIVKLFDDQVAFAGLTRRQAQARGIKARSVWISGHDTVHYWPESKEMALHLVYEAKSGRVLGVQAIGEGEVGKRVDVATQWMLQGATLLDLVHVEHTYAPPFASALDPVAVAAMVGLNQEEGIEALPPLSSLSDVQLLDVRHPREREARPAEAGSVLTVALEQLRERRDELGAGPWVVACERGTRSAEAVRWLTQQGISASYLGGGLRWRALAQGEAP